MIDGVFLIDKKEGLTSRDEVNNVSHLLETKKAGHIGTLDPFATGLMIILLGNATKVSQFFEEMDKVYIATLKLGEERDTADLTGEVISTKEVPILNKELINSIFETFIGEISQVPPMYSALKRDGKPLYKYARQGIEVERKARMVRIFSLDLLSFENDEITFISHVSKGTYIRTLGEDIAKKLGTVGYLSALRRVKVGHFDVSKAKASDKIQPSDGLSIEQALSFMKQIKVDETNTKQALNGVALRLNSSADKVMLYDDKGIIAIYGRHHDNMFTCLRGFR